MAGLVPPKKALKRPLRREIASSAVLEALVPSLLPLNAGAGRTLTRSLDFRTIFLGKELAR